MEKKYKSYILKDINKIEDFDAKQVKSYCTVAFNLKLDCEVGEWYSNNRLVAVYYYTAEHTSGILIYHKQKYGTAIYAISQHLEHGIKHAYYSDGIVIKYSMEIIDMAGKYTIVQSFDNTFNLVEYRMNQYDDKGEEIGIKIFYTDSWTIHEERSF